MQTQKFISLNEHEELRLESVQRAGKMYLDLRVYASPKAGEPKWPTGKGVLIPRESCAELSRVVSEFKFIQGSEKT